MCVLLCFISIIPTRVPRVSSLATPVSLQTTPGFPLLLSEVQSGVQALGERGVLVTLTGYPRNGAPG
jgi:hypothetical protein